MASETTAATGIQIEYEALTWTEGNSVVAHAWPLDVASSGDNEQHALKMLDEAVRGFIEVTKEMGTLEDILAESGYRLENGRWISPAVKHTLATATLGA